MSVHDDDDFEDFGVEDDAEFGDGDIDDGGFEPARPSLREMMDSNPLLKLGAIVVAGAVLAGGYMTFFGGEIDEAAKSRVSVASQSSVKAVVGQSELSPAYKEALEQHNQQTAEQAFKTGGSAMPVPVTASKNEGLNVVDTRQRETVDPLQAWRSQIEAAREDVAPPRTGLDDDGLDFGLSPSDAQPDVMPMAVPVRTATAAKVNPEEVAALSTQMRTILSAQAPGQMRQSNVTRLDSPYIALRKEREMAATAGAAKGGLPGGSAAPATTVAAVKTIIPAGNISYGQLLNDLNSDIPGPVLVQVLSGPFAGGRAMGDFAIHDKFLVLQFSRIVKDGVSYSVNAIALDEKTTLSAHQSKVDHHYFTRMILPAAAKFIEGYGKAAAQTGTQSTVTTGGGVVQDTPKPDAEEQMYKGVEEASKRMAEFFDEESDRPITVKVNRGVTMGLLFMDPVTTASVE